MSDPNTYADLEIRILEKQERGYPVEITFNGDQEFPRGFLDPSAQPLIERAFQKESGERLFRWLFAADELQAAWAQARGSRPLRRIRFRIDSTAPELHAIAWELLRDPGSGSAPQDLAAMEATPFSRYFAGQWIPGSPILKRPIRILVAIASPADLEDRGLSPIDSDEEWNLVQNAVAGADVEAVRLPDPCTLPAIEAALRKGFHVLHFVGHGQYLKSEGKAVLLLADENNHVTAVEDAAIGGMLSRQLMDGGAASDDKLRLVFLSSCQTAVRSPADAFRGLAPKLVASGVPAVLAMQDVVSFAAAHAFSQTFYRELVQHGEVDRASNAARSSLLTGEIRGASIPVLFMRLTDGRLFDEPKQEVNQTDLYQILSKKTLDELQDLARRVGAPWEELKGTPPPLKARSLIEYMERQKKLDSLAEEVFKLEGRRPAFLKWLAVAAATALIAAGFIFLPFPESEAWSDEFTVPSGKMPAAEWVLSERWVRPDAWRVVKGAAPGETKGALQVATPGIALNRARWLRSYTSFETRFQFRFDKGNKAAWLCRAQTNGDGYLFFLAEDAGKLRLDGFVRVGGHNSEPLRLDGSPYLPLGSCCVSSEIFEVIGRGTDNQFTFSVQRSPFPDRLTHRFPILLPDFIADPVMVGPYFDPKRRFRRGSFGILQPDANTSFLVESWRVGPAKPEKGEPKE